MSQDLIHLATNLVGQYVSNNSVGTSDFQGVIRNTYETLAALGAPPVPPEPEYQPAVPVKKSVTHDAIFSLIDGKPYKTLRRHLSTHGLTPEDYKKRYGLPADYPIVAPSYSAARAGLAKAAGLGTRQPGAGSTKPAKAADKPAASTKKPAAAKKAATKKPAAAKPDPTATANEDTASTGGTAQTGGLSSGVDENLI